MNRKQLMVAIVSGLLAMPSLPLLAAPGTLSQDPLFIGTTVQPNILFLVDDSGSMDWEVLKTNAALALYGSCEDSNVTGCFANNGLRNRGNLDITPTDHDPDELLEFCPGYNVMAYDPRREYTPWEGVDNAGNAYTDQPIAAARANAYNPGAGTVNLLAADGGGDPPGYYPWNDDGDGVFERGECGDSVSGTLITIDYSNFVSTSAIPDNRAAVDDLATPMINESYHDKTNYANWYTYYRKREYVTKRALSQVIDRSTARMGLATLHNNNTVGTVIRDIDDLSTPVDATAQANKRSLMDNLFQINSTGGTPLRQSLERAGNYFEESVSTGVSDLFGFAPPAETDTLSNSPIFTNNNGGACQKNFAVLLSDGFWNGGAPSVNNADGDNNSDFDGSTFADSHSNTLADVAMHYYERDLAPSLDDKLVQLSGDLNTAQHMVTYTVAFGVDGSLPSNPAASDTSFSWPQPVANQNTTTDDMRHAAWNGRGLFLSAGDPQELIRSFSSTISDIDDQTASAASVSFNSTSLDAGTALFRAEFTPPQWYGDLKAFGVSDTGINATAKWSAAAKLDRRDLDANPREIITFNGSLGVRFGWPSDYRTPSSAEISTAQIADLLADIPADIDTSIAADVASFGRDMVGYLRGDLNNDGSGRMFRDRLGRRLADVVHSAPVFVGKPSARFPDDIAGIENPYSSFIRTRENRQPLVYVGANDGMLHAFKANSGDEVFAYMPGFLFSDQAQQGLHFLADDDYTHRSYVDLTAATGDVFIGGAWRTYLVGGARAGGRGVFVLDVTNPATLSNAENNADSIVKMEFTHPDLGFTYSQITVAKMNNGKWAAIFGNGYNNSGSGSAQLFILYLDGSGHIALDTAVGDNNAATAIENNGLSSPEVLDLDNNGTADRVYAGDLLGNLWAFDLTDSSAANWGSAYGSKPLFVATDGSGTVQPITSKPSVESHPTRNASATDPNVIVTFGSGQYLTDNDPGSTGVQTFYGVWDAGLGDLDRSDLVAQTVSQQVLSGGVVVRTNSSHSVNYNLAANSPEMGWRIDLPTSGERNVVNPVAIGPVVFFNTLIPESAQCAFGGSGFLMNVSLLTGGQPPFAVVEVPNNSGTYSGIESDGVPTAPTFVATDDGNSDADRYVNTSRGVTKSRIGFGGDRSGRTSWTNLTR